RLGDLSATCGAPPSGTSPKPPISRVPAYLSTVLTSPMLYTPVEFRERSSRMAKSKTVSKAELVNEVADSTGLSKKAVKETLDALLGTMTDNIAKGNKVTLTGF